MDEIQEFGETIFHEAENEKETQEHFIVHNLQKCDNTKQQTPETIMNEQLEQSLQIIYANKVEEIMEQKEFLTKINEYRGNLLKSHENILEEKSSMSIHLHKENENINLKREIEVQLSNKEIKKIAEVRSSITYLENNLGHSNKLTLCCVRDQQQCDAGIEKLSNDFSELKTADKVKTKTYLRIIQHLSKLEQTMKVEHAEKLNKYCALLEEKETYIKQLQDTIIICHYDEKNMIEAHHMLLGRNNEIGEEKNALFHDFTLLKTKYEDYINNAENEKNKANHEISELELTCMQNTERIQNLVTENNSLQTAMDNQKEYIEKMSLKNDELEKTINIYNENCSLLNEEIEIAKQQMQEELKQYEENVKLISQEKKDYEEQYTAFDTENKTMEENKLNFEKTLTELKLESEKRNNDLLNMQHNLKESQVNLQLLIVSSEKTINELANIIQEEENKKKEELKEVEELQSKLQAVNHDFENSKQKYDKLIENALKTKDEMNTSTNTLEQDAQKLQEFLLKEKQNEINILKKKLEEQLTLKKKECETKLRNCNERIEKDQQEFENKLLNKATKNAKDINTLSESLRNIDLQIGEYLPANQNLKEEVKSKATIVQQLREKLAQLQTNKEIKETISNSNMSLSSTSTDDDYPLAERIGNNSKQSIFKRNIQMTSTPKKPAKKPKTEDLFDSLFEKPFFIQTKPKNK